MSIPETWSAQFIRCHRTAIPTSDAKRDVAARLSAHAMLVRSRQPMRLGYRSPHCTARCDGLLKYEQGKLSVKLSRDQKRPAPKFPNTLSAHREIYRYARLPEYGEGQRNTVAR